MPGMLMSLQVAPELLHHFHTDSRRESCSESFDRSVLLLLPKHLPVGFAVGIKALTFTAFPSGFQFGGLFLEVQPQFGCGVEQSNPPLVP
jgi:hypothetical protein